MYIRLAPASRQVTGAWVTTRKSLKCLGAKSFENSRQLLVAIARSQGRWTVSNAHHGRLRLPYDPETLALFNL